LKRIALLLITVTFLSSCNNASTRTGGQLQEVQVGKTLLKPTTILDGKLEILIPEGFRLMSEEMLALKYPSERRPTVVYTNEPGTINIAVNHTQDRIPADGLKQLHQTLDSTIRAVQPDSTWNFSGFQHYHGREWTQLEFTSSAIDTRIHNMMIATSVDGRMMIISFNVTDDLSAEWLPVGREIIKSTMVHE
jgi:hypothetical protein